LRRVDCYDGDGGAPEDERLGPDPSLVLVLPRKVEHVVGLEFAFAFVGGRVSSSSSSSLTRRGGRRSSLDVQVESGARVVEEDEEDLAPDVLVGLVVHEGTQGAARLGERRDYARVAEMYGEDDDLLDQLCR
jgi:hypothetical protein